VTLRATFVALTLRFRSFGDRSHSASRTAHRLGGSASNEIEELLFHINGNRLTIVILVSWPQQALAVATLAELTVMKSIWNDLFFTLCATASFRSRKELLRAVTITITFGTH